MRANSNMALRGVKALLIPYKPEHVETYHQWMQEPSLQESTASDPLTLEEEYRMQQTWLNDEDKCTFILLDQTRPETPVTAGRGGAMVGDVNLYLNQYDNKHAAEIEVMVADPKSRGKGLAHEALIMMMLYGSIKLNLNRFVAKIGFDNVPSRRLFQKLGFREESRSSVFREITFVLTISDEVARTFRETLPDSDPHCEKYDDLRHPHEVLVGQATRRAHTT